MSLRYQRSFSMNVFQITVKPKYILFSLAVLAVSMSLTGCASFSLGGAPKAVKKEIISTVIAQDSIRGFGMLKSTGQFVMMGETYWYVLDNDSSQRIQQLIDAKLQNRFEIDTISIVFHDDENRLWGGRTTLYYTAGNKAEIQKLGQLGFQRVCDRDDCPKDKVKFGTYFPVQGELFAKTPSVAPEHQFSPALPVDIFAEHTKTEVSGKSVMASVAKPFAMAADVVTLPVQLFYFFGTEQS